MINDLGVSPINPPLRKLTRESIIMPNLSLSSSNNNKVYRNMSLNKLSIIGDFIQTKDAFMNTENLMGSANYSFALNSDLEELNTLRNREINNQNAITDIQNELNMKIMLNSEFHNENEQLKIQLSKTQLELSKLNQDLKSRDEQVEQFYKYKEDSQVSANIVNDLNIKIQEHLKESKNLQINIEKNN